MKKFRELLTEKAFNHPVDFPSVSATYDGHTLTIRFDSKDVVVNAGYAGKFDPWLSSLCFLMEGKTLSELSHLNWQNWKDVFKEDQDFWDLFQDVEEKFIAKPLELLKAAVDLFQGREYLYEKASPLVCRCFGIRESDILEHLKQEENPTLETLAGVSKAGMGCRSCVPQLQRWMVQHEAKKSTRYYKEKPVADWLLEIDHALSSFPKTKDWKLEVQGFTGKQVSISFDKDASQKEEEATARELQNHLGAAVDSDLGFFLRRARHFSKARG